MSEVQRETIDLCWRIKLGVCYHQLLTLRQCWLSTVRHCHTLGTLAWALAPGTPVPLSCRSERLTLLPRAAVGAVISAVDDASFQKNSVASQPHCREMPMAQTELLHVTGTRGGLSLIIINMETMALAMALTVIVVTIY